MSIDIVISIAGASFLIFSMLAFTGYIRIIMTLKAIDRGLENPPERPQIQDKLRSYRDWCRDRGKTPIHLYLFAVGVFGAVLSWSILPWLIYR